MINFDRRDNLQATWLRVWDVDPDIPPCHYVPASSDFATATRLGLGWSLLPSLQSDATVRSGALVALGGDSVDVPLYWQQWNLSSPILDAITDAIVSEGHRVLRATL